MNDIHDLLHSDARRWNDTQLEIPDFDDTLARAVRASQTTPSRRQRLFLPVAAAAVVAALAIGLTITIAVLGGGDGHPAATGQPSIPASYSKRWVFHGLAVNTPPSFRHNAIQCSTPIADTVIDTNEFNLCLSLGPVKVTSVRFATYRGSVDLASGLSHQTRRTIRVAGLDAIQTIGTDTNSTGPPSTLHEIVTTFPSIHVAVVVASPDRERARTLTDTLRRA